MDGNGIAGVIGAIIGAVGVLYGVLRRERRADVQTDTDAAKARAEVDRAAAEEERQDDATALDQWRTYTKEREKQHNADITRLEKKIGDQQTEIVEMNKRERDCLVAHAEAKVEMSHLRGMVEQLRAEIRRVLPNGGGDSSTNLKGS